jgi:hypothetical protein
VLCALLFLLDRLVGWGAEYLFLRTRDGDTGGQINALLENRSDVVIFGDSRAEAHYVPDILQASLGATTFNAGMKGSNAMAQYALEGLIFDHYTPKLIIYDLSPYSLMRSKDPYGKLEPLYPYWRDPHVAELIAQAGPLERLFFFSRVYPYNSKFHSIILFNVIRHRPNASNGYDGQRLPMSYAPIGAVESREQDYDGIMVDYLEKFIAAAQARGVRLIVTVSPHYSTGSFAIPARIGQLLSAAKIPVIDFDSSRYPQFTDFRLFHDTGHLDDAGARIFSGLLGIEINRLEASQRPGR